MAAAESVAETSLRLSRQNAILRQITRREMSHMRLLSSVLLAFLALCPTLAFAQVNGADPTFADCSIASMSGSSQSLGTLFTLASRATNRKYLLICNTSTVTADTVGVNLAGTTAALQGTGTITVYPGSCLEYSSAPGSGLPLPPTNAINVIGTSGQPVLCLEGR
jgi:hypothetical protein